MEQLYQSRYTGPEIDRRLGLMAGNFLWIKWSATYPVVEMLDEPGPYIGIYTGESMYPPDDPVEYTWYLYRGSDGEPGAKGEQGDQGPKGDQGNTGPANSLSIGTVQGGDTAAASITGTAPAQTLNLTLPKGDASTVPGPSGDDGRGIVSIVRTSGTGAPGTIDTYTITYTDATTSTFQVRNGADGSGTGDMLKSTYDSDSDGIVDDSEKLGGNLPEWYQQSTNGLSAETALVDADTLPFYDASASAGRKTTWSNLKSILKAYFDALYTAALLLLTEYTKPAQSAAVAATDSIRTAIGKLERGLDDKAASIHASQHSEGGADAISPADIGAAVPAADLTANLAVASWAGASAPYTQTVSGLSGVTANSKLDIGLAETATDAQFTEAVAAQIRATGSGTGTVTFKAHGTKPTGDLPILIRMVD